MTLRMHCNFHIHLNAKCREISRRRFPINIPYVNQGKHVKIGDKGAIKLQLPKSILISAELSLPYFSSNLILKKKTIKWIKSPF